MEKKKKVNLMQGRRLASTRKEFKEPVAEENSFTEVVEMVADLQPRDHPPLNKRRAEWEQQGCSHIYTHF